VPFQNQRRIVVDAYNVTLEMIAELRTIVPALEAHDRDLADQLRRAANSVFLNLNEGRKRLKGDRVRFFAYASGSASEVRAALELAVTWGWIDRPIATLLLIDRIAAMTWRMSHPRH